MASKVCDEPAVTSLKSVLLTHRFGKRGDEFDVALMEARAVLADGFGMPDWLPEQPDADQSQGPSPE